MKEEDVFCEDHDETRRFNRYHRLAKNRTTESDEPVMPKDDDDHERGFRSSNYFDAIWDGRVR